MLHNVDYITYGIPKEEKYFNLCSITSVYGSGYHVGGHGSKLHTAILAGRVSFWQ